MLDAGLVQREWRKQLDVLAVRAPAAGAGAITLTVPADEFWQLLAFSFDLQLDATVATRQLELSITTPDGVLWQDSWEGPFVASERWQVSAAAGPCPSRRNIDNFTVTLELPTFPLPPGTLWTAQLNGVQAGDAMAAPRVLRRVIDEHAHVNRWVPGRRPGTQAPPPALPDVPSALRELADSLELGAPA